MIVLIPLFMCNLSFGSKNAYYCDAKCQKSDWLFHKNECNAARKTQKKKSGERQCAL